MQKLSFIKKITLAAVFYALTFGWIPAVEVHANESPLLIMVEVVDTDNRVLHDIMIGLYHNGLRSATTTSNILFNADFTTADIPNLDVRIIYGQAWISQRANIPLSDFDDWGEGVMFLLWELTPATAPTPEPPQPPATEPTSSIPWQRVLRFAIDSTTFTNAGTPGTLEAAPFIANDRTMVPLRVIAEALGATDLALNDSLITFNIDGQAFSMTVGQELPNNMGVPVIIAGRTFVPLGFIVQEMGATARWDGAARAAYIYIV